MMPCNDYYDPNDDWTFYDLPIAIEQLNKEFLDVTGRRLNATQTLNGEVGYDTDWFFDEDVVDLGLKVFNQVLDRYPTFRSQIIKRILQLS